MARLGIDFGTTNTVVMMHDRGIFSVVHHAVKTGAGTIVQEVFPSSILIHRPSGRRWYGLDAERRFGQLGPDPDHVFVPSLKRQLRNYAEGRRVQAVVPGGGRRDETAELPYDLADELAGFLRALAESICQNQRLSAGEPLEAVVTWPANANGAQRHITRRCFRKAGFVVVDTLNEPTASAIELADCLTAGRGGKAFEGPRAVAVFDLGGGTFDASVVWIEDDRFEVLAASGIEDLGGDDFDRVLLEMFLSAMGGAGEDLGPLTRYALLRQARAQKEAIAAGTVRSLFLNPGDFGIRHPPVTIRPAAYADRIRPMLRPAIDTLGRVIAQAAGRQPRVAAGPGLTIYLVGGSSRLPLVAEMVTAAFPQCRVVLTDKPFTSVAMGAAICSTERVGYRDVFARHFGLIRLRDHGRAEMFDTVFSAGTPVPRRGEPPLERVAWYHPRHNIGHLKYLECTSLDGDGMPAAGVRGWSDVLFPYDPSLPLTASPGGAEIVSTDRFADQPVCEIYRCDCDGVITVELRRPATGEARTYEIYRD